MSEISKTVKLRGHRLDKKDIEELCVCVAEGITDKSEITFSFRWKGKGITKLDVEGLFADSVIPPILHNLVLSCGSSMATGHKFAYVQLEHDRSWITVTGTEEIWVEGKCQQIKNFFSSRESKTRYLLARFGGLIPLSLLVAMSIVLYTGGSKTIASFVMMISAVVSMIWGAWGTDILPLNVIYLRTLQESWFKRNAATLVAAVVGAIIGVVVMFVLTKLFP